MEKFSLLNNIITSNNNINEDGNTEMCYRLIFYMAVEQMDSASVVTPSVYGVGQSNPR